MDEKINNKKSIEQIFAHANNSIDFTINPNITTKNSYSNDDFYKNNCSKINNYKPKKYVERKEENDYLFELEHLKIIDELNDQENNLQRDLEKSQKELKELQEKKDPKEEHVLGHFANVTEVSEFKELSGKVSVCANATFVTNYSLDDHGTQLRHYIPRLADIIYGVWIKFIFPVKLEHNLIYELFGLRIDVVIGGNVVDSFTMENIMFRSLLFNAPITTDIDNSIRIPILVFTSNMQEIKMIALHYSPIYININNIDSLSKKYKNIKVEIEDYYRYLDVVIRRKLGLNSFCYVSLQGIQYEYDLLHENCQLINPKCLSHFILITIKPASLDYDVEIPIINSISLGNDDNGYLEWILDEDLISVNICGITFYVLCFDPKYKNFDEIQNTYNNENYELSGINFKSIVENIFIKWNFEYFGDYNREKFIINISFIGSHLFCYTAGMLGYI